MQFRVFTIPLGDDGSAADAMNRFLRSVRVLAVERQFVAPAAGWTFCVEYLEGAAAKADQVAGRGRDDAVDWKEKLSPADFVVYSRLRQARKLIADTEGVPLYAILTNRQLADIAQRRPTSLGDLQAVDGVGEAKVKKYGHILLTTVAEANAAPPTAAAATAN